MPLLTRPVHGGTRPDLLDFSASVNPLGLHPAAAQAVAALAADTAPLAAYPDSSCAELCSLVAQFWHCGAEHVVCGAGAADLIYTLVQSLCGGAVCAVAEPAFTEYQRAAEVYGCTIRHIAQGQQDFRPFLEQLAAELAGTGMFFLASPANPSGAVVFTGELCAVAALCEETHTIFVLDACFAQFSAAAEQAVRTLLSRRAEFPHTIVLNAFTKFYGMAGIRLGYALCCSEASAARLRDALRPWPVGAVAQAAGIAVLKAELPAVLGRGGQSDWTCSTRRLITHERARLVSALQDLGCAVVPGDANFILFRADGTTYAGQLLQHGIAIRQCADFFGLSAQWYRIAVRTAEENSQLLQALKSF